MNKDKTQSSQKSQGEQFLSSVDNNFSCEEQTITKKEKVKTEGLTFEALLLRDFPEVAELLMWYSSAGGGNTSPDLRCMLFVAPVIC